MRHWKSRKKWMACFIEGLFQMAKSGNRDKCGDSWRCTFWCQSCVKKQHCHTRILSWQRLRGSDGGSQLFYCRLCDETGSDPYCRQSCTQCNHQIFGSDRIQAGTENCLYKRKSYPCGTYEPRYMGCRLWVSRRNLKITVKTQSSSQCTQDKRPKTPEQDHFR